MQSKKLILVIGATGAQGRSVISSLLAPQDDGAPSPYSVRALTRDPTSTKAELLASWGVELFKGQVDNLDSIAAAFEGCYGVYANIDYYTVTPQTEIYLGVKMFEYAHSARVKHYVWSGLDYASKLGNFNPKYHQAVHYNVKGVVSEFLQSQNSSPSGDLLTWSILSTGVYMENLRGPLLGPLAKRENGAVVWALPTGDGHIPAICLEDFGWWVRYIFDHRSETSGQELKVATEMMTMDQLVETFTRVTGVPAIHKRISIDEYLAFDPARSNLPLPNGEPYVKTFGDTYRAVYTLWHDNLVTRDMEWVRRIHPTGYTLESFIREKGIDGNLDKNFNLLEDPQHLYAHRDT
ncbi:hypothetical protein GYMLUDRAFT_222594 [Collybiopsis luxurians FD-317 M1]|uniref:NmrA-like domain-containing protein n=1 Tax=Collybiopsis luxurians FD-317 M1 TaxID=944289 RepID=A0A0D0D2S9_9AGAR|nr:hypothetical protein GYMLUDRAFT_222594 [Collybiopsis luxurians FD-317 M1]